MKCILFVDRSKAYAVEADIRLLAFYLHLPDRKEFALFGMNSQRLDPRTSLVEWRLFLSKNFSVELKKKSLSSFGLLLAKRGGYPHVSQSDVHFLVMGILERKGLEFDLPLYALKRGHGLLFYLGSPFHIQFFIEPGVESPSLHIHSWSG
jgi:hypothetical protein